MRARRQLAECCWAPNPTARPSAAKLVQALKDLMGIGPRLKGQRRYSALAPQGMTTSLLQPPPAHSRWVGQVGNKQGGAEGRIVHDGKDARGCTMRQGGLLKAVEAAGGFARSRDGGVVDDGGGGGDDVAVVEHAVGCAATSLVSDAKSGGVRTRSLSYSGFPLHIL